MQKQIVKVICKSKLQKQIAKPNYTILINYENKCENTLQKQFAKAHCKNKLQNQIVKVNCTSKFQK